jgi:hypothetical protein
MTDEEIDNLKWQLGDLGPANGYGSKGTKRGREVIDMTIEEMEAEIQETNKLIRKRRRRGLGLMLKPLWMLTMITCLMGSPVDAFIAYDCSNNTTIGSHTPSSSLTPVPTWGRTGRLRPPCTARSPR